MVRSRTGRTSKRAARFPSSSIDSRFASRPRIELPDGRLLVRGRSAADETIEGWSQRNPDAVAPGDPVPPVVANQRPPVRLFVYDPGGETLTAVSRWPESRTYSTAISRGLGPDQILGALMLGGGRTVAFTVGFKGAGYDVPYALYLAPIPALT